MGLSMNADIKAELVKRLRSGDYKQGQEKLAAQGKDGVKRYCCLGVLCEIAVERGIIQRIDYDEEVWDLDDLTETRVRTSTKYDGYDATLPLKVVEWAEVESTDIDGRSPDQRFDDYEGMGRFMREGTARVTSLAEMNDTHVPFPRIADYIEENVEGTG